MAPSPPPPRIRYCSSSRDPPSIEFKQDKWKQVSLGAPSSEKSRDAQTVAAVVFHLLRKFRTFSLFQLNSLSFITSLRKFSILS